MQTNDRLTAALRDASIRAEKRDERIRQSRFTSETAREANAKRHADATPKPKTATIRVEADVLELVKLWPTSMRVRYISEAIRGAVRAYETLEKIKNG